MTRPPRPGRPWRSPSALGLIAGATAVGSVALGLLGPPASTIAAASTTSTTSTTSPSTSTTLPRSTTTTTVPRGTTTTTLPRPTTTTVPRRHHPPTTTTVPRKHGRQPSVPTGGGHPGRHRSKQPAVTPAEIRAAATAADIAMGRIEAVAAYVRLRTEARADRTALAAARAGERAAAGRVEAAVAAVRREAREAGTASDQLSQLAVAAYTGAAYGNPAEGPDAVGSGGGSVTQTHAPEMQEADVLITVVTNHQEQLVHDGRTDVRRAEAGLAAARLRQRRAVQAVATASHRLGTTLGRVAAARSAASGVLTTAAVTPASGSDGPTVLGRSLLTARELVGWYRTTGEHPHTTVPMEQLAADYLEAGHRTGVRADVAFAQSIVETGYFSFPAGGQLTGQDNNFAGIGACDSCAHGWRFPTALTGVSAQLQLLDAYASRRPVPTPLVGHVGVGGCCTTWMALSGTWATNPAYGIEILGVYTRMLDWALPGRLAAAGLAPSHAASPRR
ncbi:MAG TPA: glucosaminidase domain-containing protein [Acidimicrobiales bacterium]|nr:glucosaminidase domain-containing protein [Acidimicrobiales bacterium]